MQEVATQNEQNRMAEAMVNGKFSNLAVSRRRGIGMAGAASQPSSSSSSSTTTSTSTSASARRRTDGVDRVFQGIRPVERQLMRPWLMDQINSGEIQGLEWVDPNEKTMFKIPWKHGSRQGWNHDTDACLFLRWAEHTGRYRPGMNPDPKRWKANFRCAINSRPDIQEVKTSSQTRGQNAFRVYRFLPERVRSGIIPRTTRRMPRKVSPKSRETERPDPASSPDSDSGSSSSSGQYSFTFSPPPSNSSNLESPMQLNLPGSPDSGTFSSTGTPPREETSSILPECFTTPRSEVSPLDRRFSNIHPSLPHLSETSSPGNIRFPTPTTGHADPRKLWQPSLSNSEYCLLPDYSENSFMSSLQNSHAPRPFQTSSLPTPTTTQELPVACCPVIMQDRTQLPAPASTLVPRCPAGPEFLQLLNAEMPQHDQSPPFSARGSTSFNNEDMEISLDLEVSCLETNSRVSSPSRSHSFSDDVSDETDSVFSLELTDDFAEDFIKSLYLPKTNDQVSPLHNSSPVQLGDSKTLGTSLPAFDTFCMPLHDHWGSQETKDYLDVEYGIVVRTVEVNAKTNVTVNASLNPSFSNNHHNHE